VLLKHRQSKKVMSRIVHKASDGCEKLFHYFEAEFFNDGIGEDFFGNALGLGLSIFAGKAIEIKDEKFALADVFDGAEAEP
jgi:hypothetical protein